MCEDAWTYNPQNHVQNVSVNSYTG